MAKQGMTEGEARAGFALVVILVVAGVGVAAAGWRGGAVGLLAFIFGAIFDDWDTLSRDRDAKDEATTKGHDA